MVGDKNGNPKSWYTIPARQLLLRMVISDAGRFRRIQKRTHTFNVIAIRFCKIDTIRPIIINTFSFVTIQSTRNTHFLLTLFQFMNVSILLHLHPKFTKIKLEWIDNQRHPPSHRPIQRLVFSTKISLNRNQKKKNKKSVNFIFPHPSKLRFT